ncbi:MAG: UDP-N-acetylmuramoyl-L-alanine--D-glutamate ligase [Planctomycetota bacterium]|jgi:UDP-N-acetylmuramoylalanine--D-glutamate ligase
MKKDFFAGKKVLVMGLGRFGGGVDAARFAAVAGAKVTVTDLATPNELSRSVCQLADLPQIEFHLGGHSPKDFEQTDIIIANPAVPPENEFLQTASRNNKLITSQIAIFFELCPAPIIGITGANGKSTTAALTAHLLNAASDQKKPKTTVWLSGNIGNHPFLTILDQIKDNDLVVLEISSFQAQQLAQIRKAPQVALLTNLTANHLDRHGSFENYCQAKENIFKFQKSNKNHLPVSIFCAKDKIALQWYEKYSKLPDRICIKYSPDETSEEIRANFPLPGWVNLCNLAGAMAIARHFGLGDEKIKDSLLNFKPLPHRLELVARINGVSWYNDSIATTPQSTIAGLDAFNGKPVILIAGGCDKHLVFDALGQKIAANTKAAVLIGQTAPKIAAAIKNCPKSQTKIQFAESLSDAVNLSSRLAASGDIVLLSPACASYDMFENFQQRGNEFARLVRQTTKS